MFSKPNQIKYYKMKKLNSLILSVIAISAILVFTQCSDAKDKVVTKALEVIAKSINAECPVRANNVTTMDSCAVMPGRILKTYYTIAMVDAKHFNAETFERSSKPGLVYNIQTNEVFKVAREYDVIFKFEYRDENGKTLGEITVNPEDYNQPIDETNKGGISMVADEDIIAMLEAEVAGIKSRLPMQIEAGLELTDCTVNGKTIEYTYRITTLTAAKIPASFESQAKTNTLRNLSANAQIKAMLEGGVIYSYTYNDKNGKKVCSFELTKGDL